MGQSTMKPSFFSTVLSVMLMFPLLKARSLKELAEEQSKLMDQQKELMEELADMYPGDDEADDDQFEAESAGADDSEAADQLEAELAGGDDSEADEAEVVGGKANRVLVADADYQSNRYQSSADTLSPVSVDDNKLVFMFPVSDDKRQIYRINVKDHL